MAENKREVNVDKFIYSIDSMIQSKYILVDRKIADVLLAIADTHEVYNVIAECMVNFDFREEWKNATRTNILRLPETDEKKISFIFCMLNNIDDKNIDITQILDRYFSYDSGLSPYDAFCQMIVAEFKKLILHKLGIEETANGADSDSENYESEQVDEFSVLLKLVREFKAYATNLKKLKHCEITKENLTALLSTFEMVIENREVNYFYSYKVSLSAIICKNKDLTKRFEGIAKLVDNILMGE